MTKKVPKGQKRPRRQAPAPADDEQAADVLETGDLNSPDRAQSVHSVESETPPNRSPVKNTNAPDITEMMTAMTIGLAAVKTELTALRSKIQVDNQAVVEKVEEKVDKVAKTVDKVAKTVDTFDARMSAFEGHLLSQPPAPPAAAHATPAAAHATPTAAHATPSVAVLHPGLSDLEKAMLVDTGEGTVRPVKNVQEVKIRETRIVKFLILKGQNRDIIDAHVARLCAGCDGIFTAGVSGGLAYLVEPHPHDLAYTDATERVKVDIIRGPAGLLSDLTQAWTRAAEAVGGGGETVAVLTEELWVSVATQAIYLQYKALRSQVHNGFASFLHANGGEWFKSDVRKVILRKSDDGGCNLMQLTGRDDNTSAAPVTVVVPQPGDGAPPEGTVNLTDVTNKNKPVTLVLDPVDYRDYNYTEYGGDGTVYGSMEFMSLCQTMEKYFWPPKWTSKMRAFKLEHIEEHYAHNVTEMEELKANVDKIIMLTPTQVGMVDSLVNTIVLRDAYNAQHGDEKKHGKIPENATDEVKKWHSTWGRRVKGGKSPQGALPKRTAFLVSEATRHGVQMRDWPRLAPPNEQGVQPLIPVLCSEKMYRDVWKKWAVSCGILPAASDD